MHLAQAGGQQRNVPDAGEAAAEVELARKLPAKRGERRHRRDGVKLVHAAQVWGVEVQVRVWGVDMQVQVCGVTGESPKPGATWRNPSRPLEMSWQTRPRFVPVV
eukprot:139102-Chlamydomonas_euryale.AAC.1